MCLERPHDTHYRTTRTLREWVTKGSVSHCAHTYAWTHRGGITVSHCWSGRWRPHKPPPPSYHTGVENCHANAHVALQRVNQKNPFHTGGRRALASARMTPEKKETRFLHVFSHSFDSITQQLAPAGARTGTRSGAAGTWYSGRTEHGRWGGGAERRRRAGGGGGFEESGRASKGMGAI